MIDETADKPASDERVRVLVVEDDAPMRSLLIDVLEHAGYRALEAANGRDAVALARFARPAVVLMDLVLPVLDGPSAIAILKDDPTTSRIRVVAMSAGATLRREVSRLRADGLLAKPFDIDTLLASVAVHVRHALGDAATRES